VVLTGRELGAVGTLEIMESMIELLLKFKTWDVNVTVSLLKTSMEEFMETAKAWTRLELAGVIWQRLVSQPAQTSNKEEESLPGSRREDGLTRPAPLQQ
jgi:hypothetical protein